MTFSGYRLSQRHIYIAAIVLSISTFLLGFSHLFHLFLPDTGVDGVLYLRCAAAYNEGGFKAVMALYSWPFYSIVIAYLHQLGLSYIVAARLLDIFLQTWMICFFIRIVFHFNPAPRVGFWALLCIVCYGAFNDDRGLFLRDFGYWAFYLSAFWSALVFLKTEKQRYLWLFGLSILIAALFRIEGVIIAIGSILLFFCMPGWPFFTRCRNSLIMAWPFWLGVILFLLVGSHNLYGGGRLLEIYTAIRHGIALVAQNTTEIVGLMDKALQPNYIFFRAEQMYFSMIIGFMIYKIVMTTGIVYSILAVYSWLKKALVLNRREKILWYGLITLQIGILLIFLINHLFLTKRYVLALSLLFVLWVPFGLERLYQKAQGFTHRQRNTLMIAIACFFAFSFLQSFIHTGASKDYLTDTTRWLQQHTSADDRIAVNDEIVLYKVKGAISTWNEDLFDPIQKSNCQFADYRYVVVKFRRKNPLTQCTNLKLVQSYHNEKDAVANIYEVQR